MQLQQDGDLQLKPGEVVTVAVTALNTHYLAIFADLLQADWSITQPLEAVPSGAREIRSFTEGAGCTESFAITCDFVRNAQALRIRALDTRSRFAAATGRSPFKSGSLRSGHSRPAG